MRRVRETEASDMIQFQVRRAGGYLDSLHLRKTKKKKFVFFIGWLCILDRLFGFVLHVLSVYCNRSCFFFLIYYNNIIFLIFLILVSQNNLKL